MPPGGGHEPERPGVSVKKLLRDLERGTEDEKLREELKGIRLRLEEERQRQ